MSQELLDRKLEDQILTELEEKKLEEFLQTFDGKFLLEEKWIEAAENGDERKLEVLLDLRVNVNLETASGLTALTTAAENGYADYVSLLLFKVAGRVKWLHRLPCCIAGKWRRYLYKGHRKQNSIGFGSRK